MLSRRHLCWWEMFGQEHKLLPNSKNIRSCWIDCFERRMEKKKSPNITYAENDMSLFVTKESTIDLIENQPHKISPSRLRRNSWKVQCHFLLEKSLQRWWTLLHLRERRNLHIFYSVDSPEKFGQVRELLKILNEKKDKKVFLHLLMTATSKTLSKRHRYLSCCDLQPYLFYNSPIIRKRFYLLSS